MMELDAYGLSQVKEGFVCYSHIDDYAIRDFIKSKGENRTCSYCKKRGQL